MKDFFTRNKVFIIVIFGTIILLVGGTFLFTKNNGNPSVSNSVINSSLLIPENAIVTSGFINGNYLSASSSASVTLVEFGDYECPACGLYSPLIKQLLADFAGRINYVFRNYPLTQHKNAIISSYAVEAAGLQGKYWEMHEKVFATQSEWSNLSDPTTVFIGYATDFVQDNNKFTIDMASSIVKDKVQNDTNDGNTIGITETPSFYLNGKKINLTGSYNDLKNIVESAMTGS